MNDPDRIPWPRPKAKRRPLRGLGDAVAAIANPIARAIDAIAGTDIEGCGKCKKRQAALNTAVPFRQLN